MKVAIYCRVSSELQELENQLLELRNWADQQGYQVIREYTDVASGARRREHLDDLFDDARHRRFDVVAIWSLDRLTREGPLATLLYIHRLNATGVKVYSHQEPYLDPRLPFYESIIAFLADPVAVRAILAHLGEPTAPPRIAPARGPPLWEAADAEHNPAADPLLQPAPAFEFDQRIAW